MQRVVKEESPYKPEILWLCVSTRSHITIAPDFAPKSLEALLICNGGYLVFLGPDKIGDSDSN